MRRIHSIINTTLISCLCLITLTAFAANGYQSSQSPVNHGYLSSGDRYDHAYPKNHKDLAIAINTTGLNANLMTSEDTYFICEHCKDPQWIRSNVRLAVPAGAVVGGSEPGRLLFVCRASFNKGIYPGKLVDGRCNISFSGQEITLNGYEVLVSRRHLAWVNACYGEIPPGAVIGGQQHHQTFYICQAELNGGLHPGKLVGQGCHVSWGGKEIELPYYNVLVR